MKKLGRRRTFYELIMGDSADSSPSIVREEPIRYGSGSTGAGFSALTLQAQRALVNSGIERWYFNELKDRFELTNSQFSLAIDQSWKSVSGKAPDDLIKGTGTERALKLMELWDLGIEFFDTDPKFLGWLEAPNPILGDSPITLLDSHSGIQMVLDTIGRMAHGVAA